ncbi:MAG: thermonuclease family protein [Ignavibacteriales bacterium]|nr:thermonuclease family protein [Ignavibacteriales bacterium]
MKLTKFFLISIFCFSINTFCQNIKIVKIFDSNLFLLDNGDTVRLAGIDIPIRNHYNKKLLDIANEVIDYCETNLLNKNLSLEYVRENVYKEKYKLAHIKREYPFETLDFSEIFLKKGYGKFNGKINSKYNNEYKNAEYNAYISANEIWKVDGIENINLLSEGTPEKNVILTGKEIKTLFIKTITGDNFIGTYETSDEQIITYKTNTGLKTFYKNEILSAELLNETNPTNNFTVIKDAGTSALLSLLLPGAGQIYCESLWTGFLFLTTTSFLYSVHFISENRDIKFGTLFLGVGVHIFSFIDAFYRAKKYNEQFNYGFIFDRENIYFSMNFNF